jgi:hypothetical protein
MEDKNKFLLDKMIEMKNVRFLEGEIINDIMYVFVEDKLKT